MLKYQFNYYEALFPLLIDFKELDSDDVIQQALSDVPNEDGDAEAEGVDPVRRWLTEGEYERLIPGREKSVSA